MLGDFGDDHTGFGDRGTIDHRHAISLKIHPLRHVDTAQRIARECIKCELQMKSIAARFTASRADNTRARC